MKIAEFTRVRIVVGIVFVFLSVTILSLITITFAKDKKPTPLASSTQIGEVKGWGNFGVVCNPYNEDWADPEKTVALLKDLGTKLAICKLSWKSIEKEKGKFANEGWRVTDGIVNKLTNCGIDVMFFFTDVPAWAIDPALNPGNWEGRKFSPPPKNPKDLADFVSVVVKRYKDKVKTWALFNAPQNKNHWTAPAHLAGLYKACYEAVKKEQPDSIVVMSGLEGDSSTIRGNYLDAFLASGGGKYVDMYDFHILFNQSPVSVIEPWTADFKAILKKYGEDKKPIQYGAIGWVSLFDPPRSWQKQKAAKGWKPVDCVPLNPEIQACRLVTTMVTGKSLGIERIFWTRTRDYAPASGPKYQEYVDQIKKIKPNDKIKVEATRTLGLVDYDYQPKPSCQAFKVLNEKIDGASFMRSLDLGDAGKGYLFKKGSTFTGVFWLWKGNKKLELSSNAKTVRIIDIFGKNAKTIPVVKGKCTLSISNIPLYLEGDIENITITSL